MNKSRIYSTSRKDRLPSNNAIDINPVYAKLLRGDYRRARKSGVSAWRARSLIWNGMFVALLHGSTYVSGEREKVST